MATKGQKEIEESQTGLKKEEKPKSIASKIALNILLIVVFVGLAVLVIMRVLNR